MKVKLAYQNVWDPAKAVLRRKFIMWNVFFKDSNKNGTKPWLENVYTII